MHSFLDASFSEVSPDGRQVAQTLICLLFKEELRSELCAQPDDARKVFIPFHVRCSRLDKAANVLSGGWIRIAPYLPMMLKAAAY